MSDTFGAWLERRMKESKLNDTKLAAAVGVTAPAVANWRNGRNVPQETTHLDALARSLGVSRDEVYQRAGRWIPGLALNDLDADWADIAFGLQETEKGLSDEEAKHLYRLRFKQKMAELNTEFEAWMEFQKQYYISNRGEKS